MRSEHRRHGRLGGPAPGCQRRRAGTDSRWPISVRRSRRRDSIDVRTYIQSGNVVFGTRPHDDGTGRMGAHLDRGSRSRITSSRLTVPRGRPATRRHPHGSAAGHPGAWRRGSREMVARVPARRRSADGGDGTGPRTIRARRFGGRRAGDVRDVPGRFRSIEADDRGGRTRVRRRPRRPATCRRCGRSSNLAPAILVAGRRTCLASQSRRNSRRIGCIRRSVGRHLWQAWARHHCCWFRPA